MGVMRFRHAVHALTAALAADLLGCGGETGPTQPSVPAFTAVSSSTYHTCGVTTARAAYCWGRNANGQLGDGSTTGELNPVLVTAPAGVSFAAVSARFLHTCGVTAAGAAYCWGFNGSGQLGDGTTTQQLTPVLVVAPAAVSFAAVSTGISHTCGVTPAGAAYCWGDNANGQLGDGSTTGELTPVLVAAPAGVSFAAVSAGTSHTCGVTAAGAAYCWGFNADGELGDGSGTGQLTPVPVAAPPGVSFLAVSVGGNHSCGVTASGAAYCWGSNGAGELGDGTTTNQLSPVQVAGSVSFATLTAGFFHTCGVTAAGAAYCWGANSSGRLGDGTTTQRLTPVLVAAPAGVSFAALSAGNSHSCGVTPAGAAYCWGDNFYGQLGDGTTTDQLTPVRVVQ